MWGILRIKDDDNKAISKKLDDRFYQTHRACYVNLNNIKSVDFKNNVIYFIKDNSIDYLSRNYKKGLKEKLRK